MEGEETGELAERFKKDEGWWWWWGGGSLGEMVISTTHQCAGALHKHPGAVSKFRWRIKVIKPRGWRGGPIPSVFSSHCALTRSPAHPSEIMVFAFICQRSIFQTSDKRGNWTGNRLKCCKSTKHNYQKALKLANRIHILKMLKWMSHSHNESWFWSYPHQHHCCLWSQHSALLDAVTVVNALCVVYRPLEALAVF